MSSVLVVRGVAAAVLLAMAGGSARAQAPDGRADLPAGAGDFDRVNPGIGFGWFGLADIPIGVAGGGADTVSAPVLGIRWWMGAPLGPFRAWGIDLGLGLSRRSADATPEDVTRIGFLLHAGLPLVVSTSQHVAIEFVPELNLGISSGQNADGTDVGGSRVDVGVRAGAEVFFGFMGLPQLSLEGSVGFFLSRENRSVKAPGFREASAASASFGTARFNEPWDVFRSSIAARYYF